MLEDEQREIGLMRGDDGRHFLLAARPLLISGLIRRDDGRGQGNRAQGLSLMEGEDL